MGLQLLTAPTVEPLTLDDAKLHLRVDDDDTSQDLLIRSLITGARRQVEMLTERALLTQTWKLTLDDFDSRARVVDPWPAIRIPKAPLQSVTLVQYVDANGATQTLATNQYVVDAAGEPGRVMRAYGVTWPTLRVQPNAVTVTFVAGYLTPADVPEELKQAMRLLLGHAYENREPVLAGTTATLLPLGVEALCSPYRVFEGI